MISADVVLESGLRCVVVDDPGSTAVVASAFSAAGWRHDPFGRAGTAHVSEHLLTVGGSERTRGIESVGGRIDATTHPDHMEFLLSGPVQFWRDCLRDQLDRLSGTYSIDEDEFLYQRGAVAEEIRALTASASPWPGMTDALFDDPALGHEGFGVEAELESIDFLACDSFIRGVVRPERGILVCAVDLHAVGGLDEVFGVLERGARPDADAAEDGFLARDFRPDPVASRPRTVAGPGVVNRWLGWAVPGLARDREQYSRMFALWAVLSTRCADTRFGRSGFGFVADRETLALDVGDVELDEVTAPSFTADELDRARDVLLQKAIRIGADPTALGRALALGGGADLADSMRSVANSSFVAQLDACRRYLMETTAAVVDPVHRKVDATARFSRDQLPGRRIPSFMNLQAANLRAAILQASGTRTTVAPGPRSVGITGPGPTQIRIRTAASAIPAGPWTRVPDLGGSRFACTLHDLDDVRSVLGGVRVPVTEIAVTGRWAREALDSLLPVNTERAGSTLDEAAAQWLALGLLNGIHEVARGEQPTVSLIRLAEPGGQRVVLVGELTSDGLRDAVDGWTSDDLRAARNFCAGQVATSSGTWGTAVDVLVSLLSTGTRIDAADGDVLAAFAGKLTSIAARPVREIALELIDRTDMTNVRSSA